MHLLQDGSEGTLFLLITGCIELIKQQTGVV
jgi:hypothetical protein